MASSKHTLPSPKATHMIEHPNPKKKLRVSVVNLPDLPASFNTLDDDCLGNVLDFVGKKCYSSFGRVNKRCHEVFCSKGLRKETYLFGYGPLHLIQHIIQQKAIWSYCDKISKGVLHYNHRNIFEWMMTHEDGYQNLKYLCYFAIQESRFDILREVFQRAKGQQLEHLRDYNNVPDLCATAAHHGKLECLEFLRENGCEWNKVAWMFAEVKGHDHILEYLRNNGYPTGWQN